MSFVARVLAGRSLACQVKPRTRQATWVRCVNRGSPSRNPSNTGPAPACPSSAVQDAGLEVPCPTCPAELPCGTGYRSL